jgi:hypothetical protein
MPHAGPARRYQGLELDGNGTDATGPWYMWGTRTIGGEAMFLALTWDMRYRKTGARWLISSQRPVKGYDSRYAHDTRTDSPGLHVAVAQHRSSR